MGKTDWIHDTSGEETDYGFVPLMAGSFKSDECECAINFLASKPFTSFALNATKHFHFTSMLNDTLRYLLWSKVLWRELLHLIRGKANLLMPNRWKFRRKSREDWRTELRKLVALFHLEQETWCSFTWMLCLDFWRLKHTEQLSTTDWRFETCRLFIPNRSRNVLIDSSNISLSPCTISSF